LKITILQIQTLNWVQIIADKIANGKVIGWFQGREEWGPRALGNRSILANPMLKSMKSIVNEMVKFREPFRPFAPSVIAENVPEFFEVNMNIRQHSPESFMLAVVKAKEHIKKKVPAVIHVDGTSRIQAVHKENNPLYYQLIEAYRRKTGIPMLLNTSFNLRGQPIVGTPYDALETFNYSSIDTLAIGKFIVNKEKDHEK
jgi:carbamoyltransferase